MTDTRWRSLEALFHAALEQPEADRLTWLATACADAHLREQVVRMLVADGHAAVAAPINAAMQAVVADAMGGATPVTADRRLGPWRLLRELGRGGMGVVWLARRDDGVYDAEVAVKQLPGLALSPELARRFRAERQILASMAHPNIARLIDGGEDDEGLPYLVMEHVPGEPITAWATSRALGLDA